MITINLLPEELRKKRKFNTYILALLGIAVGFFLIVVVISLVLGIQVKVQSRRYHHLDKEWQIIRREEKEVLGLATLKVELDNKRMAVEDLSQSRCLWSRKLYQLSRDIPSSIWLTDLSMSARREKVKVPIQTEVRRGRKDTPTVTWVIKTFRTMVLSGVVISLSGEEMIDSIGNFMTNLESDKEFFQDFCGIELIYTERKTITNRGVMAFELACQFK